MYLQQRCIYNKERERHGSEVSETLLVKHFSITEGSQKQTLKLKKAREISIQYWIRKSELWAFDGEITKQLANGVNYPRIPRSHRAILNKIATDLAYCKNGKRIMVDDSNNYVDAASKKQNVGFSSITPSGKLINFQIYS